MPLMDPSGATVSPKTGAYGAQTTGNPYAPYRPPQPPGPTGNDPNALNSLFQNLLGQLGAGAAQQQAGIDMSAGAALGTEQTSDQQLLQNFQNTLASLGLQQTGLGQESAYNTQQYGFEQEQQGLSRTGIEQGLQNLAAQYGLQQQGFGLQSQGIGLEQTRAQQNYQQGLQDISSNAAAGGLATTQVPGKQTGRLTQGYQDTLKQLGLERGQLGLSEKEAAQGYKYGQQQAQQQLAQLGLTGREQAASYGYGQQQIQNALQGLGLQRKEAGQTYQTGTQQDANTYLQTMANLLGQQGQIGPGEAQSIAQLYSQLFGTGGG